jgi:hypothetical protein
MCSAVPARVYIQYHCALTDEKFAQNYTTLNYLIYFSFITSLVFIIAYSIHFHRQTVYKESVIPELVFPAVFSVEIKMTEPLWGVVKRRYE